MIKELPLKQLESWPRNYRRHPADQIKRLVDSLKRNGQRKAVVVQESTNRIIAGHGVVEAARSLAWDTIRCDVWDVTDEQAQAFLVDDNELQRFANDDDELLATLIADLEHTEYEPISWAVPDVDIVGLPDLPEGEREPFQDMTFLLSDEQADVVRGALADAKGAGPFVNTGNANSNGNALERICAAYSGG